MSVARPYPEAARELLHDTLLDAASAQLAHRPWAGITMAEVARAAGVSRQTLYNEFGSREAFAQAFVLRERDRFLGAVEEAVRGNAQEPVRALGAAVEVFLTAAQDDPFVRAVVSGGNDDLLALVTTQGQPVVTGATERLAEVIADSWPGVTLREATELADAVVRLAISYATLPAGPPAQTAATVAELFGPHVERVLARRRPRAV